MLLIQKPFFQPYYVFAFLFTLLPAFPSQSSWLKARSFPLEAYSLQREALFNLYNYYS